MTRAEENLMAWLRDAHAMEKQAETMLSSMAGRIENYPELKARLETHLQETQRQAQMLESCITRRGGDTSTMKDLMGKFVAMGQGRSGAFVDDEVVKGSRAGYTFEQMEIASYKVLVAAAELVEDPETAAICERILQEEIAMADWLGKALPALTTTFLGRDEAAGMTAKH